jgi:hypothetical protein
LQLTFSEDFSKTMQRNPFEKTNLNQHYRKEVVVAVVATPLPAIVATINPSKACPKTKKQLKPHNNNNLNNVKNDTQPTQNQEKPPTQKSLHPV